MPRPHWPSIRFWILLAFALLPVASGHAMLAGSSPAQGDNLEESPARVFVTLTEPVESIALEVRDSTGTQRDLQDVRSTGGAHPTISVGLPQLPAGSYLMSWTVVSATDGHPASGSVGFSIGAFAAPPGSTEGAPAGAAIGRFLAYAGFSLAFGGAAFLMWMTRAGYPRAVARLSVLGGATLHLSGAALEAAHSWSVAGATLSSLAANLQGGEVGANEIRLLRVFLAFGAWLLGLVWTLRPVVGATPIVVAFLLGSALTFARLGHPYAAGPAMMLLDLVHLLSASLWSGGLALLARLAWSAEWTDRAQALGIRFGTLALVAVTLLAFTGVVLSVAVIGPQLASDFVGTLRSRYGGLLAGKILLAVGMVGIAAVNRRLLARSRPHTLRRTVIMEAGVGVLVLGLAGLLTAASPPAGESLHMEQTGEFHVTLTGLQPEAGEPVQLQITAHTSAGRAVGPEDCDDGECVRVLRLANEAAPMTVVHRGEAWVLEGIWEPSVLAVTIRAEGIQDVVEFRP